MAILLRGGTLLPMADGGRAIAGDVLVSGARIAQIGTVEAQAVPGEMQEPSAEPAEPEESKADEGASKTES